jgi:hypothetical protein
VLVGLAGLLGTSLVQSDPADARATMTCALEAGSGRLLCTVTLTAAADRVLSWSDALVVRAPPGARPLKARVASARATPDRVIIGFVLGDKPGGRIVVRARAVTCARAPRGGACRPVQRLVHYDLPEPG